MVSLTRSPSHSLALVPLDVPLSLSHSLFLSHTLVLPLTRSLSLSLPLSWSLSLALLLMRSLFLSRVASFICPLTTSKLTRSFSRPLTLTRDVLSPTCSPSHTRSLYSHSFTFLLVVFLTRGLSSSFSFAHLGCLPRPYSKHSHTSAHLPLPTACIDAHHPPPLLTPPSLLLTRMLSSPPPWTLLDVCSHRVAVGIG